MRILLAILLCGLLQSCTFFSSKKNTPKRETASLTYFEREDKGQSISEQERERATDDLIAILKGVSYFDFVESRVHGLDEKNNPGKYWWGHWWTGVHIVKESGEFTFVHPPTGSDNTGIQTAPYLEGACFAFLLTKDQKYEKLARKLIRGMSAWILSSSRSKDDPATVLSRALYPQSHFSHFGDKEIYINYQMNRPGKYNGVAEYVHNPGNPYFGDIYLKNNRSVDDIGHMLRAIANIGPCREVFSDETKADLDQMTTLYTNWAKEVDANNFIIPTHDSQLGIISKAKGLGDYNKYKYAFLDSACVEKLAIRLLHSKDAGDLKCGRGIGVLEKILAKSLQNDAIEILRSHHTAAVAFAKQNSQSKIAFELMQGMQERMERDFAVIKNPKLSPKFDLQDIPSFLIQAHNIGVEMTSEEMRYIYEKLHLVKNSLLDSSNFNTFHLFNSSVPDGVYSYDPPHSGLYFYSLGTMLGTCTAKFRNPNGRSLLNCERLRNVLNSK